jgi:hypothetical protein
VRADLATELAPMESVWRDLLASHLPDDRGCCAACRRQTRSAHRWPCRLFLAAAAQRPATRTRLPMITRRRPRDPDSKKAPMRVRVRLHEPDPHPTAVTAAGRDGWALDWMWMRLWWRSRLHC